MKILKRFFAFKVIDMILRITEKKTPTVLKRTQKKWNEEENLLVKLFSEHFQLDELLS